MLKRSFGIEDQDAEPQIVAKIERGVAFLGPEASP